MERTKHKATTKDGVKISFYLFREPREKKEIALIICPGFFQSKETPTFQRLAGSLADHADIISMDFRGHGTSEGFFSFTAREQADLETVLGWTGERYPRIGLLGFSLGAATAINVASHSNEIKTVIAVSSPSSFEEIEFQFWTPQAIRTGLKGLEPGAGCRPGNPLLKKERPIDTIVKMKAPILIIHGTNDTTVTHRHGQRLYDMAHEPKRLEMIEGEGHAQELFRRNPQQFLSLITDWLKATL